MKIEVYVQMGMQAELAETLTAWGHPQRRICQDLANTMKAEVRAIRNNRVLGTFQPKPKSVSPAPQNPYPRQGTSPSVCEILNRGD